MAKSHLCVLALLLALALGDGAGAYDYESNGANWQDTCAKGHSQSPIDLAGYSYLNRGNSSYAPITITYWPTPAFAIVNDELNYKVAGSFGTLSAINVDHTGNFSYTAIQFHFHAPSEHTLDGKYFPLELHIVHLLTSSPNANPLPLAVLGVFFKEGPENPVLAEMLSSKASEINLPALLGGERQLSEYFMYKGSLTTPPCSELVNWYVSAKPLNASKEQIAFFQNKWENSFHFAHGKGNNRKLMPLHDRVLLRYSASALTGLLGLALFLGL